MCLFLKVRVVLEAQVDQEAPCGNMVVFIFFHSVFWFTILIIKNIFYPDGVTVKVFEPRPESIGSVLEDQIRVNIDKVCDYPTNVGNSYLKI